MEEKIVKKLIEKEMKQSYLDYAMSVIVGRALPDVRDGLKPVHRRVLYAMYQMGMFYNKPFKKSARIVGEVLGKYHPHGDTAVYDTLVRMAQDFSLRYPLIQGQGNFGSIDGDRAAAMRYCVTGDTLILTSKGILPIKNISNKKETKIDMKVLSYNSKKNSATRFFNSGKHNVIELRTNLGYKIAGSYNHPIMCWTLKNNIPQIEWKLLENVNKRDIVLLNRESSLFSKKDLRLNKFKPKLTQRTKDIGLPSKMNKDLAFLLGSLVSEGSFHQNKIYFSNSDRQFYNRVKNIIYDQFKGIQLYERKIAGNCLELNIYHQLVVRFLKNIGLAEEKSDKKEIPFSVLQSSRGMIKEFLKGLFEGDGSIRYKIDKRHAGRSIELTYNSKSIILIEQLKVVLLNFGIATTNPYQDKRNQCYKLIISGFDSIKKFKDEINFFSDRKVNILTNIDSINPLRMSKTDFIPYLSEYLREKYDSKFIQKNNFDRYPNLTKNYKKLVKIIDNNDRRLVDFILKQKYLFNKISEISKLDKRKEVFSVKVNSKCHSFVANGFINHNTEARLSKIASEMLQDIEKETIEFVPNFDTSLKEPSVLPAKLPNLLLNGASGIAVGMATNIPPHNIQEIVDAIVALIKNPDLEINELLTIIKGPDFPTGALIIGKQGIKQAYSKGQGHITLRARTSFEEKNDRDVIIVTEIPYQVNKTMLIEQIAECVRLKRVKGVKDIRDESDREGMRIVIELGKDANKDVVLNQLYKHTRMQTTFGINMLALVDNQPEILTLKQIIQYYIDYRRIIVRKRTEFDLKKAEHRAHILKGLLIALGKIDEVITLIKKSKSAEQAMRELIGKYKLTEIQSKSILEMRLQRLTALEQQKVKDEHKELFKTIERLKEILASEKEILQIIQEELLEIKKIYGDRRITEIIHKEEGDIEIEDLIKEENMVITVTNSGYIKRTPPNLYKKQHRGGKGVIATKTKEEDFVEHLFIANTHSYILFFTNRGLVHWLKVYQLPEATRVAKGKPIVNLLNLSKDETVNAMIPIREFDSKHFLVAATKKGIIKKSNLDLYSRPRKGGIIAINIDEDDVLVDVVLTDGNRNLILATKKGMAVRFREKDARPIGRSARGVKGISLRKGDEVIGMVISEENKTLLTVTENGFGKRSKISDYRLIKRGGRGVINIKCSPRNGNVVEIKTVDDNDELMFISKSGILIRIPAKGISVIGRNTQGVRLMRLNQGDKVMSAAKIAD